MFESLSNTPFPIAIRVSLYLELISDEHGERTSIIAMVALSVNHYSTRAEIFDKFVMLKGLINKSCCKRQRGTHLATDWQ